MEKILNLDVSILVLNQQYIKHGDFLEIPIEFHRTTFDSNVLPSLVLVKLMIEKFLRRKNSRRSGLIYVG